MYYVGEARKHEGEKPFVRPRRREEDHFKTFLKEYVVRTCTGFLSFRRGSVDQLL
jgi:hypothetical protein